MKSTNANSIRKPALPATPPRKIVVPGSAKTPQPIQKGMSRSAVPVHQLRVDVKEFGAKALIGVVIVLSVTLLSLAVVTMRGESPRVAETTLPPFVETTNVVDIEPPPPAPPPVVIQKKPELPQGIITVPEIKLRSKHSFDAKTLGVKLRKGEKVSIQRTYIPETGPGWVQVERASGQTGWVLASTVQQKKARK